jgi:hypothetical protein
MSREGRQGLQGKIFAVNRPMALARGLRKTCLNFLIVESAIIFSLGSLIIISANDEAAAATASAVTALSGSIAASLTPSSLCP